MANVSAGYNWVSGETVTPAKLNSAAAPTVVVADNEVTTAKILDANVTTAKIADANVTAAKLASSAVETAKIADDAVTNDKLSLSANAGEIKKALNADNSPPIFACRAWVNFDGTRNEGDTGASTNGANVKIRASGNVASVLKNNTGDYTITFTTAISDTNYAAMLSGGSQIATQGRGFMEQHDAILRSTTQLRVYSLTDNTSAVADSAVYSVAIFR
jgi:hypothetical protein